jgi:hypothetical protein
MMAMILLSMISSCALLKGDPSLTGQIYLNEQTQDKIEFPKKGIVAITWSSDQVKRFGGWICLPKDYPHEFSFFGYDAGRRMDVMLTSAQVGCFPYETMEMSDSKDRIVVTRWDGHKEDFKRIYVVHTPE